MCYQTVGAARAPERGELTRAERLRLEEWKPELTLESESSDLRSRDPKFGPADVAEIRRGSRRGAGMPLEGQSCVFHVLQKRRRSYEPPV